MYKMNIRMNHRTGISAIYASRIVKFARDKYQENCLSSYNNLNVK